MAEISILVISDDVSVIDNLQKLLKKETYNQHFCQSLSEAFSLIQNTSFQIVVVDMEMPDAENLAFINSIKKIQTGCIFIILAKTNQVEKLVSHLNNGEIFRFMMKPPEPKEFIAIISDTIEMHSLKKDKTELVTSLEMQSSALRECLTGHKEVQHKLELLNTEDELTGIFNKRQMISALKKELAVSKRYDTDFSCLLLDIDYFRMVNGTFGSEFGDVVLKKLAKMLKNAIRTVDIAFRYGGEEFFILLPHTGLQEAQLVGKRILEACRSTSFKHGDISHNITVSIGGTSFKSGQPNVTKDLLNKVESMLKKAKNNGRNRIAI